MTSSNDRRMLIKAFGCAGLASLVAGCGLPRVPAAAAATAAPAKATATGTQLVLLGTKGGPRVGGERSNPANLLLVDGVPYVIDCGYGVARQLTRAGVQLPSLRYVFLTHMHSDHNLELGNLLYGAWSAGLRSPIDIYGPPTLDTMISAFLQYSKFDTDIGAKTKASPIRRRCIARMSSTAMAS